jgi:hypothetical protein
MLEVIINDINTKINALGKFSKVYGLCEIINKENTSFPAEWCNNDYKQVSDFDKHNGVVYHRLTGSISINEQEDQSADGCDIYTTRTYPLKTVICVKKDLYNNNDAYVEQRVAENIQATIQEVNNKSLRQALSADEILVSVSSVNVLRDSVFSSEYKGVAMFIKYEYAYLSIDYEVTISGDLSCYQNQGC